MRKIIIVGFILMLCAIFAPVSAEATYGIQPSTQNMFGIQPSPQDSLGPSDAGVAPITALNPDINSCEDLGLDSAGYCYVGSTPAGVCSNPDGFSATYDATNLDDISWSANMPVDAVVVKDGADTGNAYIYLPSLTSDSGLWTPRPEVGAGSISHIFFCYSTTTAPEFPTIALPVGMIIGFLGVILFIRGTKE